MLWNICLRNLKSKGKHPAFSLNEEAFAFKLIIQENIFFCLLIKDLLSWPAEVISGVWTSLHSLVHLFFTCRVKTEKGLSGSVYLHEAKKKKGGGGAIWLNQKSK